MFIYITLRIIFIKLQIQIHISYSKSSYSTDSNSKYYHEIRKCAFVFDTTFHNRFFQLLCIQSVHILNIACRPHLHLFSFTLRSFLLKPAVSSWFWPSGCFQFLRAHILRSRSYFSIAKTSSPRISIIQTRMIKQIQDYLETTNNFVILQENVDHVLIKPAFGLHNQGN